MTRVNHHYRARGFTLVELLIAMSLTVVIGSIAYRFLDAAIRLEEQGNNSRQSLSALEKTWQLLAFDLQNSVDRPLMMPATGVDFLPAAALGDSAAARPSMMSAEVFGTALEQIVSRSGALLWFSRHGWVNPLHQQRSELQRILYRLDNEGNLYREYWPERNQPLSAAPEASVLLLANVQSVQLGFLAAGDDPDMPAWLPHWPAAAVTVEESAPATTRIPPRNLPAAVRISVQFTEGDSVQRLFLLAAL